MNAKILQQITESVKKGEKQKLSAFERYTADKSNFEKYIPVWGIISTFYDIAYKGENWIRITTTLTENQELMLKTLGYKVYPKDEKPKSYEFSWEPNSPPLSPR